MHTAPALETKSYFINLPVSRLHVMEAGSGEPLTKPAAVMNDCIIGFLQKRAGGNHQTSCTRNFNQPQSTQKPLRKFS